MVYAAGLRHSIKLKPKPKASRENPVTQLTRNTFAPFIGIVLLQCHWRLLNHHFCFGQKSTLSHTAPLLAFTVVLLEYIPPANARARYKPPFPPAGPRPPPSTAIPTPSIAPALSQYRAQSLCEISMAQIHLYQLHRADI